MKKILLVAIVMSGAFLGRGLLAWGQDVPYTQEDRDRLIRIETTLRELKDSVDKRFEQVDKRFEQLMTLREKPVAAAPQTGFLQELSTSAPLQTMKVGEKVMIPVTVKNIGKEMWPATGDREGKKAVHLSYHWLDSAGKAVVLDGIRTELPHDLAPEESISLNATIQAPNQVGDFRLRLTMVQEAVAWFDIAGAQSLDIPVTVTAQ